MIIRTIKCAVCGKEEREQKGQNGFPNWGSLNGIALDGEPNPTLCPEHLSMTAQFVDALKGKINAEDES